MKPKRSDNAGLPTLLSSNKRDYQSSIHPCCAVVPAIDISLDNLVSDSLRSVETRMRYTRMSMADSFHVYATDTVVDARPQFHFLRGIATKQRVVNDEGVPAILARQ